MFQIRQNVFETNSSSTHSIVVQKAGHKTSTHSGQWCDYAKYEDGVITLFHDNEFGWGWDVLTHWLEKLAYAFADFSYDESRRRDLVEAVEDKLGCEIVFQSSDWGGEETVDYGHVDHQSFGTLRSFLFQFDVDVLDFIFDDRYIVIIDNDNNDGEYHDSYIKKLDVKAEYFG